MSSADTPASTLRPMIRLTVSTFNGAPPSQPLSAQFDELGGDIGRADTNQLVLPDPERTISRVHARVLFRAHSGYGIVDQGSNAISVNGIQLGKGREAAIQPGDRIQIGGYVLVVEAATAGAPTSDPFADFFGLAPATATQPSIRRDRAVADPLDRRSLTELGADHHGSLARVRAGLQALDVGIPKGWPEYVLHQMVTVMRGGEEVKLSKRAGSYVTLRDLIEEVGCDATRYFLAARSADSQLVFDIDLARAQTNDNPVYYIQYAHARICSVLNQWGGDASSLAESDLAPLQSAAETALMQALSQYPEVVTTACQALAPHMIANYLKELASALHSYYNDTKFLVDDVQLKQARLSLITATRVVLRNGLSLLGVSAPEKM